MKVRFGTTTTELAQDDDGVDATFADGSTGRYDLVVGADGIRSWTRRMLGIQLETRRSAWASGGPSDRARRASPAPTSTTAGPSYIAGYCPTGEDSLYAYIVEDAQDRSALRPRSSWPR